MKRFTIWFLVYSLCMLFFGSSSFGDLVLVEKGQAKAEIVVEADAVAGILRAAEDLQNFIEQISDAKMNIVNAPSGEEGLVPVFVGESEFTRARGYRLPDFGNSGYDILVEDGYAVLTGPLVIYGTTGFNRNDPEHQQKFWQRTGFKCGLGHAGDGGGAFNQPLGIHCNDDLGPWYAVSALLEMLGVRFYAPYEDGTIVPQKADLSLPTGRYTKEAAFGRRHWTYYNAMRHDRDGVSWLKRLGCGNHTGIIFNHTTADIIKDADTVAANPDWLAEESPGKKFPPHYGACGVPNYSDPGFRAACVAWARAIFDTFPQIGALTLGPPDGGIPHDWRDRKKYESKGISEPQGFADIMWDFNCAIAQELKKSHPDKGLLWYCRNELIPNQLLSGNAEVPDNLIAPAGVMTPQDMVLDTTFRNWQKAREDKAGFFRITGKGVVGQLAWQYWLAYRSPTAPRYPMFFGHRLQELYRYGIKYMDGTFMEVAPAWQSSGTKGNERYRIGEVPLVHLMMYVNMKLLWDPDLDLDALLNEYYRLWFGPAEAGMKDFHEFAEQVWSRQESRSVTETSGFLKEEDVPLYFEKLAAAKALTEEGSLYYKRIQAMEDGYAPLKKLFPGIKREGKWIRNYRVPEEFPLDGDLHKYPCNPTPEGQEKRFPPVGCGWHTMVNHRTGEPLRGDALAYRTHVSINFQIQSRTLCIAAICFEPDMNSLVAGTKLNDDFGIFNDDVIEIYLDSPQRSYFKIVVNSNGAIWDESQDQSIINRDTQSEQWNPGTRAIVRKYDDRWEMEVRIPCADLGALGPTKQYPWGLQVGRTRISNLGFNNRGVYSLAPTGGPYNILSKWTRMWVQP